MIRQTIKESSIMYLRLSIIDKLSLIHPKNFYVRWWILVQLQAISETNVYYQSLFLYWRDIFKFCKFETNMCSR